MGLFVFGFVLMNNLGNVCFMSKLNTMSATDNLF